MRWLRRVSGFLMVVGLLGAVVLWGMMRLGSPVAPELVQPKSVFLEKGAGSVAAFEQLAEISQKHGGGLSAWQIRVLALASGQASNFKVGEYEFDARATLGELLGRMVAGKVTQRKVRLAEGVTWREIRRELAKADLVHDAQGVSGLELLKLIGVSESLGATNVDGLLFPDTYFYRKGERESDVLRRAHALLLQKVNALWERRVPNLPYASVYDVLIVASIVEKETGLDRDRPMIAAGVVNRLRAGMPLGVDATIVYGAGDSYTGDITFAMLRTDGPYNTRLRRGLPPTPIATCGLASLEAAVNPAQSDVLYWMGRGDGTTEFNSSFDKHNAAVQKFGF